MIEWGKDDIDALRFMKVDVLALGMLSCMRRGLDLLADHKGIGHDLATIPQGDKPYAMIRRADTLGTFQIERRALCCQTNANSSQCLQWDQPSGGASRRYSMRAAARLVLRWRRLERLRSWSWLKWFETEA